MLQNATDTDSFPGQWQTLQFICKWMMSKQYSDITQVNLKFDLVEIIEILSLLLFKLSVNHKGLTLNDDEIFMLWIMYDIVFFFFPRDLVVDILTNNRIVFMNG